ncbi:MAG: alpha/beta hydrolase [Rhodospirillaceae bacterium]|jgi:acetyl esterase|nr:alpha/beta hydrolase [Rhodospirillaceae bacterium]MBT4046200.1 alpha/beta hydrolase [Rhodospirillaceae bacterium]MBT4690621.1 alpha/beta hydrolase [Rhodospirillaceae bacterium]MBT5080583.1 alpha/beta hydrolase [Rhodospirillaceae bacterium]MBT5526548.1 alpha/beta hydrolase [Rhodospirillaceae bacterium]
MSSYDIDDDFKEFLDLLPTKTDYSTVEKIQKIRLLRAEAVGEIQDRDDIEKEDRTIAGPEGAPDVSIRIYRPVSAADKKEQLACVFEIHGGGFIFGSIDQMDLWCQRIAADVGCMVVSVEYRLAPENPFPAGLEDCYTALCWTADQAAELGIDPGRIAISGHSAGAGLAAGTALLARDRGAPALCFQLLEIPELDDRLETASMKMFTDTPLWNLPNAEWSWRHYLGPDHEGEVSPYAAPARATDLSNLPPAYISTMEFDPLRDEGILYAMALMHAGISVELHSYAGTFHGSSQVPGAEASRRNLTETIGLLRRRLGTGE